MQLMRKVLAPAGKSKIEKILKQAVKTVIARRRKMSWYCEVNPDHNDVFNDCLICDIVKLQNTIKWWEEHHNKEMHEMCAELNKVENEAFTYKRALKEIKELFGDKNETTSTL